MAFAVVFGSCQRPGIKATSRLGVSDVPRYFFHFSDGKRQFTDDSGKELSGIAAARAYATEHVREMKAAMSDTEIHDFSGWTMTVVDGAGKAVFEIGFDLKPPRRRP
jgi:hypothetical protein